MTKILFIVVLSFYSSVFAADKVKLKDDGPTEKQVRDFGKDVIKCLNSSDRSCLEKHVAEKMYFIEHEKFGCSMKGEFFKRQEFSECVFTSNVLYDSNRKTLLNVLKDCFGNPKSEVYLNGRQMITPDGFLCFYELENGKFKIGQVVLGD